MLRNSDGTPYKASGSMQQFDPENPEHCLFNQFDQELIEISGSPIFYYEIFIQVGSLDKLYREDRGKLWSNHPIQLWAFYEPQPSGTLAGEFGIDSPSDDIIFEMNYRAVLQTLGHLPKIGARIFTPHRRENWVVIDRKLTDPKMWGEFRLQVMCTRFQESITTGEGKVTQAAPDFNIQNLSTRS